MPKSNPKTKKERSLKETIRKSLLIFFSGLAVFSLIMIISNRLPYWKSINFYDETAQDYTLPADNDFPSEEHSEDHEEEKLTAPIKVDFEGLRNINEDIVGWIYCEGTSINYPILHGVNNDTYIHTTYQGEYAQTGSIFIDYQNDPTFSDGNTIIYGHNMTDGSMFAALSQWQMQSFLDEHPIIWLLTPSGDYAIQVFSAYITTANDEAYSIYFSDTESLSSYVQRMRERSYVISDMQSDPQMRFVLLSTCTNATGDLRSVVHGMLMPADMITPNIY